MSPAPIDAPPAIGTPPPGGVRVAFQGERGAYGEDAIDQLWHGDATPVPLERFDDVVRVVRDGSVDYGVLPIENSVVGTIAATRELLRERTDLVTVTQVTVAVRHALLAPAGATLASVASAASHPVALAQCGAFLRRHPHIAARVSYDTAGAAREVAARGHPHEAAIASVRAALRYHLTVLAEDIQDRPDNATCFVVVARHGARRDGEHSAR